MERKVFSIAWKQGKKRRLTIICLALLVLLIGKCCLNGKTEYEAIRFGLDDFAKERDTESPFYVKDGEDDGLKPVAPNLMRMPKILKPDISLSESLSGDEPKCRHKGWAYYNNPELTVGICKVVRAGEGWVIVKPESEFMYGRCFGYINTDDEYLKGDDLKAGFYYLIGKKKAKVGAGSALTINEYVMVPEPGVSCALAAVEYNLKAKRATQEENALRNRKKEILEKLPAVVDDLHIKEFKNKVHLPAELVGRAEVKLQSKEIEIKLPVGFNSHKFAIEDLKRKAVQKDLSYFLGMALQIQSDGSDIVGYIDEATVSITCSNIPSSYKCCVVYPKKDRRFDLSRWGESSIEYAGEIYVYEDGPAFKDVTQGFEAHDFVLRWKQKYGVLIGM